MRGISGKEMTAFLIYFTKANFELHVFVFTLVYTQDRKENTVNILVRIPVSRKGFEVVSDDIQQRTAKKTSE
jgi:hypothetical protein